MSFNPTDIGDGILMYCSQSDEGLGDFAALVIKDQRVEFRFDIGSGMAIVRSSQPVQAGVWTSVRVNRDFKEAKLSVNDEPVVEGKSPGGSRTMTLNTPLYIGGVDRRRITVNKGVGVDRSFRGCISEVRKMIERNVRNDDSDVTIPAIYLRHDLRLIKALRKISRFLIGEDKIKSRAFFSRCLGYFN